MADKQKCNGCGIKTAFTNCSSCGAWLCPDCKDEPTNHAGGCTFGADDKASDTKAAG